MPRWGLCSCTIAIRGAIIAKAALWCQCGGDLREGGRAISKFTIGLDSGTNSVRAVIVRVEDGEEVATSVWNYKRGEDGVIVDPKDPHLAR